MARNLLPTFILAAIVLVTFHSAAKNGFVNWDDQNEITENEHFNPVTLSSLEWNWSNTQLTLYMPVTYMVWGGVARFADRDPHGILLPRAFHELNVLLHLICTLLVYCLIFQLCNKPLPAFAGALLFAVHPLQVEPVAWASGMYTLLSTAFSLAAIITYVSSLQTSLQGWKLDVGRWTFNSPSPPKPKQLYWLATFFYILALLSKAASVSVPLAAMVIDVLILRRPVRKSIRSLALWVLLGIPIVWIAKSFQDVSVIAVPPLWARPIVALDAFGFYLRKVIWPPHLFPDYGRNPTWAMQHPIPVLTTAAVGMAAVLIAVVARRRAGWITAGLAFLLAGVGPYLGLTTFDFQYVSTVADRYAYFGMVGVAMLIAGAAARWRWSSLIFLIAAILCIPISRAQINRWHDTDTLFHYTLNQNPQSLVSHGVFGFLAAARGDFAEAETGYLEALKVWPEDTKIHFNLGNLYLNRAHALRSNPAEQNKRLNQAVEHYSLAVKYQPKMTVYRNSLAAAWAELGQFDFACAQWREVIRQDPLYIEARNNLADMLVRHGNAEEARQEYRAVLRIDPYNQHANDALRKL